jgi:soluble lytic murein transglycosylase-like protein
LGHSAGRCRTLDPWLAALAIASGACAGGSGSGHPFPIASPAPAATAPRDSVGAAAVRKPAVVARRKPVAPAKAGVKAQAGMKAPVPRPPAAGPGVDSTALEFAVTARLAHGPLTRAIARRTRNSELAERAAWAVTREAGRLGMSPSLLAAVLLIENRQLDSAAVSSAGAIGLMQVMPLHAGSYGCASSDLRTVDANICHGARILHLYMVRSRSVTIALRRYNGCVRGSNTPRCERYPVRVLQTAARLRRDILVGAAPVAPKAG